VKVGESTVHVVRLKPDGVILAFDAPDEVPIVRDDAKSKERKQVTPTGE
jgi:sRNA-binding carbon storage regulator CsrA